MSSSNPSTLTPDQLDALQSRFAMRVCERLDNDHAPLPHDISERLRVARQQAMAAFTSARQLALVPAAKTAPASVAWASGQVALAGAGHLVQHPPSRTTPESSTGWGWRVACALPIFTLLLGFWGIHQWHQSEKIQAAVDVDVALLTDKLPPAAYADPGFEEFLQNTSSAPDPIEGSPQPTEPVSL
jgi:Protein of unknown function (DUF3619)